MPQLMTPKKDSESNAGGSTVKPSLDTELDNEKDTIRPQNYNRIVEILDRAHCKIDDIKKRFLNGQISSYSEIKDSLRKMVVGSGKKGGPPDTYPATSEPAT